MDITLHKLAETRHLHCPPAASAVQTRRASRDSSTLEVKENRRGFYLGGSTGRDLPALTIFNAWPKRT